MLHYKIEMTVSDENSEETTLDSDIENDIREGMANLDITVDTIQITERN